MTPEIKTVKINNKETDYFSFGEGKTPFLMLPGVSVIPVTSSASAIEAAYSSFKKDFTVYVFDRIKTIEKGYTVKEMTSDLADVLSVLGIENACIFGASQGGMMGFQLAIDYPHLVKKLAACSAVSRLDKRTEKLFKLWCNIAESGDNVALNDAFFKKVYSPEYYEKFKEVFAFLSTTGTKEQLIRVSNMLAACFGFDVFGDLPKIKDKLFVCASERDEVLFVDDTKAIISSTGCENYIYSGYSHAVYDEAPDYKERLFKFFSENS